ncbi:hypothetical protein Q8G35_09150 [Peribacillus simplex]|uniref:Uncharacterized protein n=2 Tax=Peribacillus TaxID=2675229 RepID=A0AA90P9L8_9BACI|nr:MULTISPECIES: hypothetical protein [Peribacillus]MDP1418578.1 hypothetical protein [Peribacillus simplex]MDP1451444.1 hypothetical protein [Peribacillus frigoritolerans]
MTEKNKVTPQIREPYWRSPLNSPSFSKLDTDITIRNYRDYSAKQGIKVTPIEAGAILNGTTGHTTAWPDLRFVCSLKTW